MPHNVGEALAWGERTLFRAGNGNARMEALWLLASVTRDPAPTCLFLKRDQSLPGAQSSRYRKRIAGRSSGVPLAYILRSQEFMGLDFFVDANVLVPRPETEVLVRETLRRIGSRREARIADIGTGSGIIAVSLAKNLPDARVAATDVSGKALRVARRNARSLGLSGKILFLEGGLFQPLNENQPFDAIVSNPPYVRTAEIRGLQKEIQFEPRIALDGGKDGMKIIARLISDSIRFLKPGGSFLMEMGRGQAGEVLERMRTAGYSECLTLKDPAGLDRVAAGIAAQ